MGKQCLNPLIFGVVVNTAAAPLHAQVCRLNPLIFGVVVNTGIAQRRWRICGLNPLIFGVVVNTYKETARELAQYVLIP